MKHAFTLQQSLADFHWTVHQGGQQMTQSRNEERPDVWFPNIQLVLSHIMLTLSAGLQAFDSAHLCLLPPVHWESISFRPSLSDKKEVHMIWSFHSEWIHMSAQVCCNIHNELHTQNFKVRTHQSTGQPLIMEFQNLNNYT